MEFAFTLKPDHSLARTERLTRLAEASGFTYGWVFDSHVLWKEPYVLLTLMAQASERLRLGTCVTNPATREPSVTASALAVLQLLSHGRMDLGIGRGDSARRVLGKPPTTLATLEEATATIRELCEGRAVEYEGTKLQLDWAPKHKLPVWIAGYGPKALAVTGRVADGAIIQIADPELVRWCVDLLHDGAEGGRDPKTLRSRPPRPAGPRAAIKNRVPFPALVSDVVDLVRRYGEGPPGAHALVKDRPATTTCTTPRSAPRHFVDDESVDRFCVTGEVEAYQATGARRRVTQFNLYLMNGDERRRRAHGKRIIPALKGV